MALHGNSGPLCESTITSLSLRAEWLAHAADVGKNGERDRDLAATVLDEANPVLLGQLAAGCAGALFARDPSLPDPPRWAIAAAPPAVAAAAEAELASVQEANGHADWAVPPKKTFLEIAPAAGGGRWVAALLQGAETCHEDTFVAVVWRWSDDPAGRAQVFAYRDRAFAITAAADFTGDGIPELVLDDGLLIWDPGRAEYGRLAIVDFRREVIDACHCECE